LIIINYKLITDRRTYTLQEGESASPMLQSWSLEEGLQQMWTETDGSGWRQPRSVWEVISVGGEQKTLGEVESNLELLYVNSCSAMPEGYQVVVQGSAEVSAFSELFYT